MVPFEQRQFTAADGSTIYYRTTPVTPDTQRLMLIVHGMAEYAGRYHEFADMLFRRNTSVIAIDLRGHGATGEATGCLGHFADADGWDKIVGDIGQLTAMIKADNPDLPLILFGHSMGSVAARTCLVRFGAEYDAAVICGTTTGQNPVVLAAGTAIAKTEIRRYGAAHPSTTLAEISFGGYNKKFAPNRTAFDWLSVNTENVDAYIADPLCGFFCSSALFRDMFSGIKESNAMKNLAAMPKDLPVLLIAGGSDPVGGMGKEVRALAKRMKKAGLDHVTCTLIDGKRHEILNEDNRRDVYAIIAGFIESHTA